MPLAFSYSRFSSAAQQGNDSLRRQRDLAEKYVLDHPEYNLTLDDDHFLVDEGLSAYSGKHSKVGALGRFLRLVEDGEVPTDSWLLVESLDRLSRQAPLKALSQLQGIVEEGITIATLQDGRLFNKDNLNSDGGLSLLMVVMESVRSHTESQTKGKRVAAAWKAKRNAIADGVPLTKSVPFWINKDNPKLLIEDRAALVRHIYEWFEGGLSVTGIIKRLNDAGIEPPSARLDRWSIPTISKLLDGHQTKGTLVSRTGDVFEGYYAAAVDPELWERVQLIRARKKSTRVGVDTSKRGVYPISGLCECACGRGTAWIMGRTDRTGAKVHYVRCGAARDGGCRYDGIRLDQFLRALDEALRSTGMPEPEDADVHAALFNMNAAIESVREDLQALLVLQRGDRHNPVLKADIAAKYEQLASMQAELIQYKEQNQNLRRNIVGNAITKYLSGNRTNNQLKSAVQKIVFDAKNRWIKVYLHDGRVRDVDVDWLKTEFPANSATV